MLTSRRRFLQQGGLAAASLLASQPLHAAGEPIRIGAPGNYTGAQASLDTPLLNGLALKLRELNAAGGLLGRMLQLVSADMATDPARAWQVAQELEREAVVAAIGFSDTDSVLALAPLTAARGLPFITPGATSPQLPQEIGPTLYLACFGDNVQAAAGAEFLLGRDLRRVHLLHNSDSAYTRLLAGYFQAAFEHGGGTVLARENYVGGDASEIVGLVAAVSAAPPADAIYLSALPDEAGSIVAALRSAGLTVPIVGGDGYDTPLLQEQAGPEVREVYYSTHVYMGNEPKPAVLDFMSRYWTAFGYGPIGAFAALGYDALGLLAEAIGRAGSTAPQAVLTALSGIENYDGVTGRISYGPDQRVPLKSVSLIGLDRGELRLAAELVPAWVPDA